MVDAFALAIVAGGQAPAYPGVSGHEPDFAAGRRDAGLMRQAFAPLEAISGAPASYVSETDYFHRHWREAFWGENYPRLLAIKRRYDPSGLFKVHHGVGS
jgi:FAD/FMN-containing dehydrogenase